MYSASREIEELAKRVFRLERRALGTPQRNAVDLKVEEMLRNQVRDLKEKLADAESLDTVYLKGKLEEANETAEQFKQAAEQFKKDFWAEREAGAEAGAEMAKLRNENRMLVEGVNHRAAEITRQQDRSLALLGSLRESHTKIKNQKKSLAEMDSAHDKALDRIKELKQGFEHLNASNKELTSDANLAFTYEAQLAQAKKEMADAGAVIGALRKENAELKEAKSPKIGLDGDIHDYYAREVKENVKLKARLNHARVQILSVRQTLSGTAVENLDYIAENLSNEDN